MLSMNTVLLLYFGIGAVIAQRNSDVTIFKSDNRCPERFVYIDGKCFWFFRGLRSVNREFASTKCKSVDARLAQIADESTQREVAKWIRSHEYRLMSYWIGLSDSNGNREFRWDDDTTAPAYTSWSSGEPRADSNRKCVVMASDSSHKWKSVSCSNANLFICEANVEPSQRAVLRSAGDISSFCQGRSQGYHAHPTDCRRYILCFRNQMRDLSCAKGEVFNPNRVICTSQRVGVFCNIPATPRTTTTVQPTPTEYDYYNYDYGENGGEEGGNEETETPTTEATFQEYSDYTCEDSSYTKLGKKCYKIFLKTAIWSRANEICIGDEKGQLVVIKASWEQDFLVKELRKIKSPVYDFWIGLNDQKTEDTYVWSDGSTLSDSDYQNWKNSARKRLKHLKKCVELSLMSRGKWEDNTCFNVNGYICEKAAVNPFEIKEIDTRGKSAIASRLAWTQPSPYCGKSRGPVDPLAVIGGVQADMAKHPWQASLRSSGEHRCGGSLIGRCWVLTAAHCVDYRSTGKDKLPTLVVLGDYDTSQPEGTEKYLPIVERIVHPQWAALPVPTNDIALVRLAKCVDDLNPICLPSKNFAGFSPGAFCKVAGWGTMDSTRLDFPANLQEAVLPLLSQDVCESKYIIRGRSTIQDSMLCAGRLDGGVDTCQGDSGGPLACRKSNSDDEIATMWGVVSWGFGCARKDRPGVYTRVSNYMDWIRNHTKINF